jgi:hypothetical protein
MNCEGFRVSPVAVLNIIFVVVFLEARAGFFVSAAPTKAGRIGTNAGGYLPGFDSLFAQSACAAGWGYVKP